MKMLKKIYKQLIILVVFLNGCNHVESIQTTPIGNMESITPPILSATRLTATLPSVTFTPLHAKTPTPTVEKPILGSDIIAIQEWGERDLFLMDLMTGVIRKLEIGDRLSNGISWINDGCEIIVSTRNKGIVGISLDGDITRELLPHQNGFYPKINPINNWLAFLQTNYYSRLDILESHSREIGLYDLKLLDLQNENKYLVSTNGSVTDMVWSQDGRYIAFNDSDLNGVHQLFLYSIIGMEKHQLTNFILPTTFLSAFQWSLDGSMIAFVQQTMIDDLDYSKRPPDKLVVTSLSNENRNKVIDTSNLISEIYELYWLKDNKLVVYGVNNKWDDILIMVDINTGGGMQLLPNDLIEEFSKPVQMGAPGILLFDAHFVGKSVPYKFILETGELIPFNSQIDIFYSEYWAPPFDFKGETSCIIE